MKSIAKDRSLFVYALGRAFLTLAAVCLFPVAGFGQAAITCPAGAIDYCADQAGQVCVDLPILGADSVKVTGSASAQWSDGKLCFSAVTAGVYPFEVIAYDSAGTQSCQVTVNVGFGQPPSIICPPEPYKINLCSPGEVCLVMAARGVGQMTAAGAKFANGNMCFQADTSGVYRFVAVVRNACGADTCHIEVQVTVGAKPVITCLTETPKYTLCMPERICISVPIQGADSVESSAGATWSDGSLCFTPDTSGEYLFHVLGVNKCGKTACDVRVQVVLMPKPTVVCPVELPPFLTCGAEKICAPVAVQNASSVVTSLGSFENGLLCFTADTSGTYKIKLVATNDCSSDSCEIAVTVVRRETPVMRFEARALDGDRAIRERGRFGLVLEPHGSLETLIALPGRHARFEVLPLAVHEASDEREQKVRRKGSGRKRRRPAAPAR